jgi:hypothetical protein
MPCQKILLAIPVCIVLTSCSNDFNDNDSYGDLFYGGQTQEGRSLSPAERRAIAVAIPYFIENGLDTTGCSYKITQDSVNFQVEYVKAWDRHVLPGTSHVYYTFSGGIVTLRRSDLSFVSYGTVDGIT